MGTKRNIAGCSKNKFQYFDLCTNCSWHNFYYSNFTLYLYSKTKFVLMNNNVFVTLQKHIDPEQTKSRDFIRALVTVVCHSTIEGR